MSDPGKLAETILHDCVNDDIRSWIFGDGPRSVNDTGDQQLRFATCGSRRLKILEGVHIGRDVRIPPSQGIRSAFMPSDLVQAQVTIGPFFQAKTLGQLTQQLRAQGLPLPPSNLDPNGLIVAAGTMNISTLWRVTQDSPSWTKQVLRSVPGGWTYPNDITLVWAVGPFI